VTRLPGILDGDVDDAGGSCGGDTLCVSRWLRLVLVDSSLAMGFGC